MTDLLDAIRAATAADATPEARAAGATACRALLSALEGDARQPRAPAASAVANVVAALRGVPPDQLLDFAIAKLRAALPPEAVPAPMKPLAFHLVPVPRGMK